MMEFLASCSFSTESWSTLPSARNIVLLLSRKNFQSLRCYQTLRKQCTIQENTKCLKVILCVTCCCHGNMNMHCAQPVEMTPLHSDLNSEFATMRGGGNSNVALLFKGSVTFIERDLKELVSLSCCASPYFMHREKYLTLQSTTDKNKLVA